MWILGCAVPLYIALFAIVWTRRQRRSRREHPFREFKRRPAGESLRLKVGELDDTILDQMVWFVCVPTIIGTVGVAVPRTGWLALFLGIGASSAWAAIFGFKIHRLLKTRSDYQLGFEGERYVGEALTPLIADGFDVFHDVPFDGYNIDHVLVGPPGVFTVETKTRRKPINADGKKEYRVEFDGRHVHWPWGPETREVDQAVDNARSLGRWLSSAVGESVPVTAILTLPGWYVPPPTAPPTTVHVVNQDRIVQVCNSRPATLSSSMIKRIRHQLDQKCHIAID